jgi:hypothetical protein
LGISNPFAALVKVASRNKTNQASAAITRVPTTTVVPVPDPDTGQLINANGSATPYSQEIALLRQKADRLAGSKPVGIDAFKLTIVKWGAALLPIASAVIVGDIVAVFFLRMNFGAFGAYGLSFVLELITMILTYAISHALTYQRHINIPMLVLTLLIWLAFLAAQAVLLIAIGGAHPGTLIFVAVTLRAVETALSCTASTLAAYWTRGKSPAEELAMLQQQEQTFIMLHTQHLDRKRNEQQAANQQRMAEQHLVQLERNSDMLMQIGEKMSEAALKVFDRLNQALDDMGNNHHNPRGW